MLLLRVTSGTGISYLESNSRFSLISLLVMHIKNTVYNRVFGIIKFNYFKIMETLLLHELNIMAKEIVTIVSRTL